MKQWARTTWDRLRSSYWFLPTLMAIASIVLALVMVRVDEHYRDDALRQQGWVYSGGPEGARAVLSTIAGSIITVAGTTFSITIAALSLASAQFGPRLLRNFMRDTGNQVVLGTFTSTFLYCLLVLRTVRGMDELTYVPHISVTGGVVLAVLSLGVLIYFIHHIAESIQVAHVIDVVSHELNAAVSRLFPDRVAEPADEQDLQFTGAAAVLAHRDGYVQAVDQDALVEAASTANVQLRLVHRPGDYVLRGTPLAIGSGPLNDKAATAVRRAFTFGRERTPHQDAEFAFLQLAEVALRALSPGVNDPFTAIMCIDRITSAMKQVGERSLPSSVRRDPSGKIRIVAYPYDYEDLVRAAYRHIREAAEGHWQVLKHLEDQLRRLVEGEGCDPRLQSALRNELLKLR